MKQDLSYNQDVFEKLKKSNEYGSEYWLARELAEVLDYSQWRNFNNVINKDKEACKNSGNQVSDHFADVSKMISAFIGTDQSVEEPIRGIFLGKDNTQSRQQQTRQK